MSLKDCIRSAVQQGALSEAEGAALEARYDAIAETVSDADSVKAQLVRDVMKPAVRQVTRDEIVRHLEQNRVALRETFRAQAPDQETIAGKLAEWRDERMRELAAVEFTPTTSRDMEWFYDDETVLRGVQEFAEKE